MPFNFEDLRFTPTFELGTVAKKLLTAIPVRKPRSGLEFFRIRPESDWVITTYLLDLKEGDEEKCIVIPDLVTEAFSTGRLRLVTIYAGITYPGQLRPTRRERKQLIFWKTVPIRSKRLWEHSSKDMRDVRNTKHRKDCPGGGKRQGKKFPTTFDLGPDEIDTSQFHDCSQVYGGNCPVCIKGVLLPEAR